MVAKLQKLPWYDQRIIQRADGYHTDIHSGGQIVISNAEDAILAQGSIGSDYLLVRGPAVVSTMADMPETMKLAVIKRDIRGVLGLEGLIPPREIKGWRVYNSQRPCVEFSFFDPWTENWFLLNRNVWRR